MIDLLRASLEECQSIKTRENIRDAALLYIAARGQNPDLKDRYRLSFAINVLETQFLPHISTSPDGSLKKAYFVGYMVNRLLTANLGRANEDDRDHYGKKRMDMSGTLMAGLFRQLFRQFIEDMSKHIKKDLQKNRDANLQTAMRHETLTAGLRRALSTGNWGKDKEGNIQKTGVSQVLNRLTFASSLSHMRRLTNALSKQGKQTKPR
jgi:DNA-directed RNA polymerase II subunit RPB2